MRNFIYCVLATILLMCCTNDNQTKNVEEQLAEILAEIDSKNSIIDDLTSHWEFEFDTDEMTDEQNVFASLISKNTCELDFPYGETRCTLCIRKMGRRGGIDAMVLVSSGQIYGSEYKNDNYILVRFDDETPIKYWYNESASGSSDVIFIRKTNDFIEHCKKAKVIKVEVPMFDEGRKLFTFEAKEPFTWKNE